MLYHLVPHNLSGSVLYPLNELEQAFPKIYAAQAKKYAGREVLTQQIIPSLECAWNNVLHLSPVHPKLIRKGLESANIELKSTRWFELDPIALGFNQTNAVIYLHPPKEYLDFTKMADDFRPFNSRALASLSEMPEATLDYYRASQKEGKSPLLFHRIPHVLYRGNLHLKDLNIIVA